MKLNLLAKLLILLAIPLSLELKADVPSTHGMLFFGKTQQYVSHLPMFHAPHDYQAIAQVELGTEAKNAYLKDSSEHPSEIYTIEPERFSLPEKFQAGKSFKATLFRGHFERGGIALFEVQVTLSQIVAFRKLVPVHNLKPSQRLILFGIPGEFFSAHQITNAPDFDQIALVKVDHLAFPNMMVTTQLSNKEPLKAGQTLIYNPNTRLANTLEVLQSLYVEFDDLGG